MRRFTHRGSAVVAIVALGLGLVAGSAGAAAPGIVDPQVIEGDSGTRDAAFLVELSVAATTTVHVDYFTTDGTALAREDYVSTEGTLTFAPGETQKVVMVPTKGDEIPEPDETFFFNLADPSGGRIAVAQGVGTIVNDDSGITIGDVGVSEGDSGTREATFVVELSTVVSERVRVNYSTSDGTALAHQDYESVSGEVSFARGETSKVIKVPVFGDTDPEEDETFFVNLAHASNAEVLDVQGDGVIVNDDAQISVVAPVEEETTTTTTTLGGSTTTASVGQATRIVGMAPTPGADGYWVASASGGISALGAARFNASLQGSALAQPIVGMAAMPKGQGYWMVASDGGIFAFGDARFFGSTGAIKLAKPIVGMGATPSGQGYWLVAADGGIFAFGDAVFRGSTGGLRLAKPIVGMAATPSGLGYWLVASDGGIFAFGDADFHGSTGNIKLNRPIVGMGATPSGRGYWLVASDGGIFTFGDAHFFGSTGALTLAQPIVGMVSTPSGQGYWMVAADGGIFTFGDAKFLGAGQNPL